jgi:S1-C subfamily serine protease
MNAKRLGLVLVFLAAILAPSLSFAQDLAGVPSELAQKPPAAPEPGVAIADYYRDCVVWVETNMTVDFGPAGLEERRFAALGEFPIVHTSEGAFIFQSETEAMSFVKRLEEKHQRVTVAIGRYEGDSKITSGGSGFFCDDAGGFYTVAHVAKKKDDQIQTFLGPIRITEYSYWVTLNSKGRKWAAEAVGVDVYRDLAYMRAKDANPADYKKAKMGDPKKLRVGEPVYTYGAPFELEETLTRGVVSSLNRVIGLWYIEDFIQTDAPINPGNSGSPLLNSAGEVVGLNDAGIRGADGMGFAVPVTLINLDQLKRGDVELPWFGAEAMLRNFKRVGTPDNAGVPDIIALYKATDILDSKSIQELLRLTHAAGFSDQNASYAIVTEVQKTKVGGRVCPALRPISGSALKRGDLIIGVSRGSDKDKVSTPIRNGMDLRIAIVSIPVGQPFEIEYIRVEKGIITQSVIVMRLEEKPKDK